MIRLIFELFIFYILYKFIFEFVIPIYRTTKQVKGKMQQMQQHMQEQERRYQSAEPVRPQQGSTKVEGDYIEYEEIK